MRAAGVDGWLLDGRATMPAELGYFLGTTWRLHPDLTLPVSHLAYEDLLSSHEPVTAQRSLDGVAPGLHVVPVKHADRTLSAPEEAEAICHQRHPGCTTTHIEAVEADDED